MALVKRCVICRGNCGKCGHRGEQWVRNPRDLPVGSLVCIRIRPAAVLLRIAAAAVALGLLCLNAWASLIALATAGCIMRRSVMYDISDFPPYEAVERYL